jgi:hypothetical protein
MGESRIECEEMHGTSRGVGWWWLGLVHFGSYGVITQGEASRRGVARRREYASRYWLGQKCGTEDLYVLGLAGGKRRREGGCF